MTDLRKSSRVSLILGIISVGALLLSNFALLDIQHGDGHVLEWSIMHVSYVIFILFHVSAIVTFVRILRKKNGPEEKKE
jgi:hypothetical protein